jgi:hypothetical protein
MELRDSFLSEQVPVWQLGSRMSTKPSEPETSAPRKWCPLCQEWREAVVAEVEEVDSAKPVEMIYCPKCGAKLRASAP